MDGAGYLPHVLSPARSRENLELTCSRWVRTGFGQRIWRQEGTATGSSAVWSGGVARGSAPPHQRAPQPWSLRGGGPRSPGGAAGGDVPAHRSPPALWASRTCPRTGPARGHTVTVRGEPLRTCAAPSPSRQVRNQTQLHSGRKMPSLRIQSQLPLNSSAALRQRLHVDTEINPRRAPQFSAEKLKLAGLPLPVLLTALSATARRLRAVTPSYGNERSLRS